MNELNSVLPNVPKKEKTVAPVVLPFVKLSELTLEDVQKLPNIKVTFTRNKSKQGSIWCQYTFEIHKQVQPKISISEDEFIMYANKLGISLEDENGHDINAYKADCKYRYVKGQHTNGEYKEIDLILGKHLYKVYFIGKNNYALSENFKYLEENGKIKPIWYVRTESLSDDEIKEFNFDE